MADEVARLVAVMEAQLRGFTKGMEQAQAIADQKFGQIERRMNQSEKRFSNSFRDLAGFATRIGGALGIAFSVEGLINFGKQVLVSTAQLSEQAQQAQVGVEALQAYRIAFKEAGSSAETADRALGLLNKTLGEAQEGSTSAREAFQRLHLSFQDVANAKPDERLALVAKALLNVKDGATRAALETQFFGRSGREIESVLAKLAGGVKSLTDEYKEQGRIITDELAKKTDAALDRMSAAWDRAKAASVPTIASIASAVANLLSNMAGLPASVDQLTTSLIAAQSVANRNRGTSAGRAAQARVDQLNDQLARQMSVDITPGFEGRFSAERFLGTAKDAASSIGALDKFFAKMQLIASLASEIPSERARDEKLIEAAAAKLEQEGRSNLKLLKSMKDVNDVLNEQVGLRDKILKIIEEENAADAKSKFTERLDIARRFEQVGATTIKAPEIPKVKADEEQFKRVSEEFGTDAATALDRRLHGDQATVPDVTVTPRNENTPRVAEPIPALDQAAKEHTDKLVQERLDAIEETSKKLSRIENAEQTIIDELTEESRIAGELPRKREEEIELLRVRERFGADFAKQHEEEIRGLVRSKQAAEDFVNIEAAAIDGLAEIGANALTGSKNVQQAFADMLKFLAQYIIKLELAKALESALGSPGSGGGGILGKAFDFLGSAIFGPSVPLLGPEIPSGVVITPRLRASGGPVKKDEPYLVGEQGKELFVPDISGFIIPNKKTEEILRTQDGRASGGPVSRGKPYVVGETGRELFIPSTSGFVYRKEPDGKGGTRDTGRMVFAGQPIIVGDVGVEVFVPDFPEQQTPQTHVRVDAPSIATNQQTDNRQTESNTAHTARTDIVNEHQKDLFAPDVAEHIQQLQSLVQPAPQASNIDGRRSDPSPDMRTNERADEPLPQSPKHVVEPQIQHDVAPSNVHIDVPVSEHSVTERSKLIADALRTRDALRTHDATIISDATKEAIERVHELDRLSNVRSSSSELHTNRESSVDRSSELQSAERATAEFATINQLPAGSVPAPIHTVDHLSDVPRDDRVSHTHSKELHAGADRQMDRETIKAQRGSQSHTYVVGDHGEELFIPNVAGFIYPKAPPEKGTRDIARVLSAGQPIIVGQRGEEIFAPYISDVLQEAPINLQTDTSTRNVSTNDNRSVSQDVNEARFSNEVHPAHTHAGNRTSSQSENSDDVALTHIDGRVTNDSRSFANAYSHYHKSAPFGETIINLRRERAPEQNSEQSAARTETQEMHPVRSEDRIEQFVPGQRIADEWRITHIPPAQAMGIREPIHGQVTPEHPDTRIQAHYASPRASGGPVSPGYMYIVGERGREMFSLSDMNDEPDIKMFAFGGILGSLLGGFGPQAASSGSAFDVLKILGLGGAFGGSGSAGIFGSGFLGDWLKNHLEQGGIVGSHGRIPLHSFASGGIANSPQLAIFGEGSGPEAFVPLQGGKIPVRLQIPNISTPVISGGSSSNSIYVDARGAQVGVAEQIQQALTRAFPTFVGAAVNTVDKNFPSMFRKAHRDRL